MCTVRGSRPNCLSLREWISSYYCAPIGMTLATMLPAAVKKNVGSVRKTMIDLAPERSKLRRKIRAGPFESQSHQKSPKQQAVIDLLQSAASLMHDRVEIQYPDGTR